MILLLAMLMPLQEIEARRTIGDVEGAVEVAEAALSVDPTSQEIAEGYIVALSDAGHDRHAAHMLRQISNPENDLIEEVAWATIKRGAADSALTTRQISAIAAAMTHDIQAVDLLITSMRSSSALMRATALQLAPSLRDAPLQEEILRLLDQERNHQVRLAAIQAAGQMEMHAALQPLINIIAHKRTGDEERWAAIAAVVTITEQIEPTHLSQLAQSRRGGLRQLACAISAHLEEHSEVIQPLLNDPLPAVRESAMIALAFQGIDPRPCPNKPEIPYAYALTLTDPASGMRAFESLLQGKDRHKAAAALARTGSHGLPLMQQAFHTSDDLLVRANLAMGLIGQRVETKEAAKALVDLLDSNDLYMFEESHFRTIAPSKVRHGGPIPNRPQVVDQLVRLELIRLLAILEHPKALPAVRQFLTNQTWGITGLAAMTLLQEGDEEAIELIRACLQDSNPNVRVQAAIGLAMWGRDPSAIHLLAEAYPQADRILKLTILEALGAIGHPSTVPFLIEALQEPFPTLRIVAAAALIQTLNA